MATTWLPTPVVSVTIAIDPPTITTSPSEPQPTISVTATSYAIQPITIFTWYTIFNLKLRQKCGNFTCVDLNTNAQLRMATTKGPQRCRGFSTTKGHSDEQYYHTLEPGVPKTFTYKFGLAYMNPNGERRLEPGHRYRLGLSEGENIEWWRYGTKDEVMLPAGDASDLEKNSAECIYLHVDPVEFDVV